LGTSAVLHQTLPPPPSLGDTSTTTKSRDILKSTFSSCEFAYPIALQRPLTFFLTLSTFSPFITILRNLEDQSRNNDQSTVLLTERELDEGLKVRKGPDNDTKSTITEAANRFRSRIGLKTKHRRMIRTAKGWLGMGPSSLRVGDRVFVVPGANIPLIMRRLDPGHYQVVGEAYIHGIMHGEAVFDGIKTTEVHLGNETDNRCGAILLSGR
jgi:hypothetical protein